MKISRAAAYAIGSLIQLVESDRSVPVPCSQLAQRGKMPERFLLQVLRNLVNHGLLKSTRGVEGGYSLAKSADEITLQQVILATDGPTEVALPETDALGETAEEKLLVMLRSVDGFAATQAAGLTIGDLIKSTEQTKGQGPHVNFSGSIIKPSLSTDVFKYMTT